MENKRDRPLVYSCSGCSSAAQLANWLAVRLDRLGEAEMSCIAGVGGDVPSLVAKAKTDRPIVVIDGCALSCALRCLQRHDVTPVLHHRLSDVGVRKRPGQDFDPDQAREVLAGLRAALADAVPPRASLPDAVPARAVAERAGARPCR